METHKKIHNMSGSDERREVKEDKVEKKKIKIKMKKDKVTEDDRKC